MAARGGDPLLNLDVLRAPALPAGLAALAVLQVAYGGLLFAFTLHLQAGLGQSALRAGLSYLPMAAAFGLAGLLLAAAARRGLAGHRPGRADRQRRRLPGPRGRRCTAAPAR